MNTKYYNEAFAQKYGNIRHSSKPLTESFATELKDKLYDAALELKDVEEKLTLKATMAYQDTIEKMVPDKSWWEVTDLNIFYDLFENRDIQGCIDRIIDNLKPEYKDSDLGESLTEAANPENAEINALIKDRMSNIEDKLKKFKEKKTECLNEDINLDVDTSEILLDKYENSFVGEHDNFEADFRAFKAHVMASIDQYKVEYKVIFDEKKSFDAEQRN